jgi:hypothetical protein
LKKSVKTCDLWGCANLRFDGSLQGKKIALQEIFGGFMREARQTARDALKKTPPGICACRLFPDIPRMPGMSPSGDTKNIGILIH